MYVCIYVYIYIVCICICIINNDNDIRRRREECAAYQQGAGERREERLGRGDGAVGDPHRARISKFELFELMSY